MVRRVHERAWRDARRMTWRVLWLALALVGAQSLAFVHALSHGGGVAPPAAGASGSSAWQVADDGSGFGHAAGSAECSLWSGLLGGSPLPASSSVPALVPPAVSVASATVCVEVVAPRHAAFDARGPPAGRRV